MSLPESVQAINDHTAGTMNTDIPGGGGQETLSADTMVTSLTNQLAGNLDGKSKQNLVTADPVIASTMSATQLIQSIINANQNSNNVIPGQQQTTDIKNTKHDHVPLPDDLQSFKGNPFTLSSPTHNPSAAVFQNSNYQPVNDLDINKDPSGMMGHHSQNPMFSSVTSSGFVVSGSSFGTVSPPHLDHHNVPSHQTQVLQSFSNPLVSSQQMPTSFSEALHLNMPEDNLTFDSLSKTPALSLFENLSSVNPQTNTDFNADKSSVLERLLTSEHNVENKLNSITSPGSHSVSSPDYPTGSPTSSSNSPYTDGNTPAVAFTDTNTQSSLIIKSEKLRLDSTCSNSFALDHEEIKPCLETFSWDVTHIEDDEIEHIEQAKKIRKAQKCSEDADAPTSVVAPSVEQVFDAGEASAKSADFTFSKFGKKDETGVFTFGSKMDSEHSSVGSLPVLGGGEQFKTPHPVSHSATRRHGPPRKSKEPILNQQFPSKLGGYELKIISQPEEQHRARYLTEGSRGSVKNRTGEGYPCVKLFGLNDDATLQVFIGNDTGRTRPHGFYQACKVCGKNATMCTEKEIDGTNVIEIDLRPVNDMTASVDCVGILKLRNADVEQRIGIAKAKKKSTKARMIFRVNFQKSDGNTQTLQIASHPILCTQPIGQPEICKMSLKEGPVFGGEELFIIGKNFLRGTKVFFQELSEKENGGIKWEKESEIDRDYFQPTHIVCTVPEYTGIQRSCGNKVVCQVVINSGGKLSEGQPFTYCPADLPPTIKQEVPMETEDTNKKAHHPFAAPEALELNQQIQQVQQESKTELFQLPPGVISEPVTEEGTHVPMEQGSSVLSEVQTQAQSEFGELISEHTDRIQGSQQQNYQHTADTDSFMTENNVHLKRTGSDLNPVPVTSAFPQTETLSDNFSFQQSNFGIPKSESVFTTNTNYSDSIVTQFLENMSEALQSQTQETKTSETGHFSTSSPSLLSESHNQTTLSTDTTNMPRSSSGHLFGNNEQTSVSSMDFSLNSSPVKVGLQESQPPTSQPVQSEILPTNILNTLDHLQFSLEKDTFPSVPVVPDSSKVHLPTDTMMSNRENLTAEARMSSAPAVCDSNIHQINRSQEPAHSPLKDQIANPSYQTSSDGFNLLTGEQHTDFSATSQSLGITDTVPHLNNSFQGTSSIPDTLQQQSIAGSVQQNINPGTILQGRLSTDSCISPQKPLGSLHPSEHSPGVFIPSPEMNPLSSPDDQIPVSSLTRNSSFTSIATPGLNTLLNSSAQNAAGNINLNMSNQMTTSQLFGGQQSTIIFSQAQLQQGTSTTMSVGGSVQAQPGLGNHQNMAGSPQIIICNNPPAQGLTPQLGPSIVIMPGSGAGGPHNQVENLLRSILGTLSQPPPQPQQQSQQVKFPDQQHAQQQLQQQASLQTQLPNQQQQHLEHQQQQLQQQPPLLHQQQRDPQQVQSQQPLHNQLQNQQQQNFDQQLREQQQLEHQQRLQQLQLQDHQQQQQIHQQQNIQQQQQQFLQEQQQFQQHQETQQFQQQQPLQQQQQIEDHQQQHLQHQHVHGQQLQLQQDQQQQLQHHPQLQQQLQHNPHQQQQL